MIVAMDKYDRPLYSDAETSVMSSQMNLFRDISNYRLFADKPIILIFNRYDLFKEKIKNVPIDVFFRTATGESDQ